jgi:TonB family protein
MHPMLLLLLLFAETKDTLTREQIAAGIGAIRPKVEACHTDDTVKGTIKVTFHILPSGKVGDVEVVPNEELSDTPLARCVVAAAKTATFPAFQGKPMSVRYPFNFN